MRRYTGCELLIIDELGYVPCDADAADLLFRIVSKRHENRAIIITTNLPCKQWGTVLGDAPCLGALIDRFAKHSHVMDICRLLARQGTTREERSSPSQATVTSNVMPRRSIPSPRRDRVQKVRILMAIYSGVRDVPSFWTDLERTRGVRGP